MIRCSTVNFSPYLGLKVIIGPPFRAGVLWRPMTKSAPSNKGWGPGCIPHKSNAETPRVSKFHAKRLISGQNPTPIHQGMLLCYQLSCHRLAAKERPEDSGNDFASRSHVVTYIPAPAGMNMHTLICRPGLRQMSSSPPAAVRQKL